MNIAPSEARKKLKPLIAVAFSFFLFLGIVHVMNSETY